MDQRERSEFVLLWVLATCDTFILYNLFNLSFLESLVIGFLLVCMFIGLGEYNGFVWSILLHKPMTQKNQSKNMDF